MEIRNEEEPNGAKFLFAAREMKKTSGMRVIIDNEYQKYIDIAWEKTTALDVWVIVVGDWMVLMMRIDYKSLAINAQRTIRSLQSNFTQYSTKHLLTIGVSYGWVLHSCSGFSAVYCCCKFICKSYFSIFSHSLIATTTVNWCLSIFIPINNFTTTHSNYCAVVHTITAAVLCSRVPS